MTKTVSEDLKSRRSSRVVFCVISRLTGASAEQYMYIINYNTYIYTYIYWVVDAEEIHCMERELMNFNILPVCLGLMRKKN